MGIISVRIYTTRENNLVLLVIILRVCSLILQGNGHTELNKITSKPSLLIFYSAKYNYQKIMFLLMQGKLITIIASCYVLTQPCCRINNCLTSVIDFECY